MSTNDEKNNNLTNPRAQQFGTPEEEIVYLKNKLAESQSEFLEYQESSRELETEYETQIKQLESKNEEYLCRVSKLEIENDQLKSKYAIYTNDTQHRLNEYQEQLTELQALNTRLTSYIRELEQNNDDLERARRALAASLEDFEFQLNQQIERNVLLENEVSEKEELECVVQRLKEETRDLKHELTVHSKQNDLARRKQLLLDNAHITNSLADSSIQANSPKTHGSAGYGSSASFEQGVNKSVSLNSGSPSAANGSFRTKPLMVDSTTSPIPAVSQFSFDPATQNSKTYEPSSPKSTDTKSQQTSEKSSPSRPAIVMSPSSRLSALSIVSDLLRKVVSLESKLSSSRKITT